METVKVDASKKYDVIIGRDTSALISKKVKELFGEAKVCVVSDSTVAELYMQNIRQNLTEAQIENDYFVFPKGEQSKNPTVLFELLEYLAKKHFTRKDVLIALGGGVTGDMTGLAAAMYMRGMHLVQMPTTLLAMVDSSVGGKTAVNLEEGKNLVGVFNQPELVLCDIGTLGTLPAEYFADGMAEVIKDSVIADRELFDVVKSGNVLENLEAIIARCVIIKRNVVHDDEFDTGKRQLLNFGHTIAHSIEKVSDFSISHGSAVAMGMVIISEIAYRQGWSKENCSNEIIDALLENNLPISCPYKKKDLFSYTTSDKKCSMGKISLIVPERIGHCVIKEILSDELKGLLI